MCTCVRVCVCTCVRVYLNISNHIVYLVTVVLNYTKNCALAHMLDVSDVCNLIVPCSSSLELSFRSPRFVCPVPLYREAASRNADAHRAAPAVALSVFLSAKLKCPESQPVDQAELVLTAFHLQKVRLFHTHKFWPKCRVLDPLKRIKHLRCKNVELTHLQDYCFGLKAIS